MEFGWGDVNFEVRRRANGDCHFLVLWYCVDIFVISLFSSSKVLLSLQMVGIDDREQPRRIVRTAQVEFSVVTAPRYRHRAFYGVEKEFGSGSCLLTHHSFLMYFPSAVVPDIDELRLLHVLRGKQVDAATFIIAFEHLRDLDWAARGLASAVRSLPYRHVHGFDLTGVSCTA